MNDDFGNLRSLVETLQHRRPWTNDWLEPWSASLSVLSALVYGIFGSFATAVFAIQILGAGATGAAIFLLVRDREQSARVAAVVAFLALTFPTVLWKSLEYTSLVVYLPCLLWALWAAEHRRWSLFLVIWAIALTSRQSAIVWAAIPLWIAMIERSPRTPPSPWRIPPAIAASGGVLVFAMTAALMNKTQSQSMVTDHLWTHLRPGPLLHHLVFGLGLWTVMSGIGGLLLGLQPGAITGRLSLRRGTAVVTAAVCLLTLPGFLPTVLFEHKAFEAEAGTIYRNLVILAGLAGWLTTRFAVRWEWVFASVGALALICLRRDVWDYYFLDVAVFAVFGVVRSERVIPAGDSWRWPARGVMAGLALLVCFHAYFTWHQKCRVDRDYAACVITERALRNHSLDITEIGRAPFGFIGWHLHPYFLVHEGKKDAEIGGFRGYLERGTIEVRLSPLRFGADSRSLRPVEGPDASRVIESGIFRVGWVFHQRYTLLRSRQPTAQGMPRVIDPQAFRAEHFPLNDAEWASYIATGSIRPAPSP